jgi:hypothetical protein
MDGKKDAAYCLKHLNNLPEPKARALEDLAAECSSRRMLALTVEEVEKRLGLAATEEGYLSDPLSQLSCLRRYMLTRGIAFAPCGNPADVAFGDPLFITPAPVMTHDEDISAVARLARSGRTPSPSDLGAIRRTTAKMNAYNVMLRVFENLCAVRSGQLGAVQLDTLNRILGSLELPLEGENYLRVCLSYASQVGVKHCDYSRPETLYPALADKLMAQVDEFLARVCAASSYPQPLDKNYPRIERLRSECARFTQLNAEEAASDPIERERRATMSFNRSRVAGPQAAAAAPRQDEGAQPLFTEGGMHVAPGATGDRLREARGRLSLLERVRLSIPAAQKHLGERLRTAAGRIMQGLPMPGKITIERSPLCKERLIVRGDAAEGSQLAFGIIPRGMDPQEYCKRDERPWGLANYLRGEEPASPSERDAMREISAETFFLALIAAPLLGGDKAFKGVKMADVARQAAEIFEGSLDLPREKQRTELGALYALHRTLAAPRPQEEESSDTALLRGLFVAPGVLNAYVQDRMVRAGWLEGRRDGSLKMPCMLAGLCEILRTSKPLARLLSRAPGRVEFFDYCKQAFEALDYFDGKFALERGTERRLDFEGMPEPLLRLGRLPLAAFIMQEIASRRGFNELSEMRFRVDSGFASQMDRELRSRQDALAYLSSAPSSASGTVAGALCGRLDPEGMKLLRAALSSAGTADDGTQARLPGVLRGAENVLGVLLESACMVGVPDPALPREILRSLRWSSFCPVGKAFMDDSEARLRFAAAQCALFMFMTIAPASRRSQALVQMLDAPEEDQAALAGALQDLEDHCRSLAPKTPGQIRAMNLRRLGPSFNGFFQRCLKKLASIEMAHSVFAAYERSRFDEMFKSLGIRGAVLPPAGGRRGGASAFDSLDADVIKKRVSETREVEDVISKLKEEEEGVQAAAPKAPAEPARAAKKAAKAAPAAHVAEASGDKAAMDSPALPGLSPQALELFKTVAAQNADAIDSKEFEGLCRSHGYMSGDAAIEELNGWCFDNLDEGVFEAAPEEGCVYVSTDILSQIVR